MAIIEYNAEPTAIKFHADDSFFRGIRGPIGSGKSVMCAVEIYRRAMQQAPTSNGVRYSRWAVVRNTYPELKSTTIKTCIDCGTKMRYEDVAWRYQDISTCKACDEKRKAAQDSGLGPKAWIGANTYCDVGRDI